MLTKSGYSARLVVIDRHGKKVRKCFLLGTYEKLEALRLKSQLVERLLNLPSDASTPGVEKFDVLGELLTLDQMAARSGLTKAVIWRRMFCQFQTPVESMNAEVNAKFLIGRGNVVMNLDQMSAKSGVSKKLIERRMYRYFQSPELAMTPPKQKNNSKSKYLWNGAEYTVEELAEIACLALHVMRYRLKRMTPEQAMAEPDHMSAKILKKMGVPR